MRDRSYSPRTKHRFSRNNCRDTKRGDCRTRKQTRRGRIGNGKKMETKGDKGQSNPPGLIIAHTDVQRAFTGQYRTSIWTPRRIWVARAAALARDDLPGLVACPRVWLPRLRKGTCSLESTLQQCRYSPHPKRYETAVFEAGLLGKSTAPAVILDGIIQPRSRMCRGSPGPSAVSSPESTFE